MVDALGIDRVLKMVSGTMPSESRVCWINLREEPLLYINGTPYVLRQEAVSLRNVKSYAYAILVYHTLPALF